LGKVEVYSNEGEYPEIFEKTGTKGDNFYYGGQTELFQDGNNTYIYVNSMLAKRIKTHFINLIQIVTHNPDLSDNQTPYVRFIDKAISIKTTTLSSGAIFMQPFGDAILYKQEQGLELYKATVCTFDQRYDA